MTGLLQPPNAALSRLHWKLAPASLENSNVADVTFVGFAGLAVMAVSGAVASIVQAYDAEDGSVFPAPSIARTSNV
jgi:hypothetical protein